MIEVGSYDDRERKFPAPVTEYRYRQDSAGPGQWRRGNGIIREFQTTTDTEMSLWFERSGHSAWGLFGGQGGAPPEVIINPGTPRETRRLKTNRMPSAKGTPAAAAPAAEADTATPSIATRAIVIGGFSIGVGNVPVLSRRIIGAKGRFFPGRGHPPEWEVKATKTITPNPWNRRKNRDFVAEVVRILGQFDCTVYAASIDKARMHHQMGLRTTTSAAIEVSGICAVM